MQTVTAADYYASMPWIDRPDADIDAYVRRLPPEERDWAKHYLEAWRRDGIIILENAVDELTTDALLADIDHLVRHPAEYNLPVEVEGKQHADISEVSPAAMLQPGSKFNSIHAISAAARAVSLNAPAMRFLRHVFCDDPAMVQSLTFFRGSQQWVHVDYPYVRNQTKIAQMAASWVALEDINIEAGALAYWPGAHDVDKLGLFDWGNGSILYEPDSSRTPAELCDYLRQRLDQMPMPKKTFTPKRGDCLIWHCLMPHEGTPVTNQALTRKSYVTHYTCKSAYPTHFMKPNALENKHFDQRNGGYYFHYTWLDNPRQLPSSEKGFSA
ncbi:MAG TPA: phytanoyl-CoA dioxygenase family protein [Candidatus Acidoferrum sp.]|nr:phytanoyl-CoA dioxygenase family protein [Candidatus Acidoferrum sp.]